MNHTLYLTITQNKRLWLSEVISIIKEVEEVVIVVGSGRI